MGVRLVSWAGNQDHFPSPLLLCSLFLLELDPLGGELLLGLLDLVLERCLECSVLSAASSGIHKSCLSSFKTTFNFLGVLAVGTHQR